MILRKNITEQKIDLILVFLLLLLTPLFFYKLGQSSLVSFDEAWYADIGRNILNKVDLFNLYWNGNYYIDHPPAGFWFIALGQAFFGINEFGARFSSALFGLLTVVTVFFLGRDLFKDLGVFGSRLIGITSAIALSSSPWFLYRARSANLDATLTFLFVLTIYLAYKSSKSKKYLIFFTLSLVLLILTKSVVPFTILPVLLVIFWKNFPYKLKDLVVPSLIFLSILGLWFFSQLDNHDHFLERYLSIGLPGVGVKTSFLENLKLMKEYLHNGIGKWFWPGVISIFLGPFLLKKRFFILSTLFISFFTPFLFSQKGHIWHLIPLHPFMILSFFGFFYTVVYLLLIKSSFNIFPSILNIIPSTKKFKLNSSLNPFLAGIPIILICAYYSFLQIRRIWYEFVDIPAFVSDEAILSKEAGKYPEKFYLDGDFGPSAVFYSGKIVEQVRNERLKGLFEGKERFLVITNNWRLTELGIGEGEYMLLKSDRDKVLILKH